MTSEKIELLRELKKQAASKYPNVWRLKEIYNETNK